MHIIFNEVRAYRQKIASYAGVKPTRKCHGVTVIVTLCIFLRFLVTVVNNRKEISGDMEEMYMENFVRSVQRLDGEDYVRNSAFLDLVILGFSTSDIGTYYLADIVDLVHYDMNDDNCDRIYQTLQNDNNEFMIEMASYYEIPPQKVQRSLQDAYEHVSDGSVLKQFSTCASECAYLIARHLQNKGPETEKSVQLVKEITPCYGK